MVNLAVLTISLKQICKNTNDLYIHLKLINLIIYLLSLFLNFSFYVPLDELDHTLVPNDRNQYAYKFVS